MWRAVVSQPLNRYSKIAALGELDQEAGEFWVENPFMMMEIRANLSSYERNRAFLNVDGESFIDVSFASAVDIDSDSRSVIAADFNRDGATDLLVGSVGGGPLRLFLNRFPTQNSARIELVGVESNRPAIGTRLVAHVGSRQIVRDVFPANGFMGQGPVEVMLGLGLAKRIERLQVRWPSGKTQEFTDLSAGQTLVITEGHAVPITAQERSSVDSSEP
jgi:hypothetical protein